jgi:hypothetical protein
MCGADLSHLEEEKPEEGECISGKKADMGNGKDKGKEKS